ncbi:hypothetical protein SH501x_005177 [Pirellulaceae bacterium SH501]
MKFVLLCESGDSDRIGRKLIQKGLVYDVLLVRRSSYDLFELTIRNSIALIVHGDRSSVVSHGYFEALGGSTRVFFTPLQNSSHEPSNDEEKCPEGESLNRTDFVNVLYNFLCDKAEDVAPEYVFFPNFDRKDIVLNVAELLGSSLPEVR